VNGRRALWLAAAATGALAASPWLGPALEGETAAFVLRELRLPRAALGVLVGATLAMTGAAFQIVFENPLASPTTLGTTAGAGLGALAVLVFAPTAAASLVGLGAFFGALSVSFGLAALARSASLRADDLVLAGVALSVAAGAATTGLQLRADAAATLASVRWAMGTLSTVGWDAPVRLSIPTLLTLTVLLAHSRALQALSAGADRAATLGVDTGRVRARVLLFGALGVAACVATTGPIAFIGLLVPHVVRRVVGAGPRALLGLSAVVGAGFLPLADALSRLALPDRDLPVGVVTAALGAPTLLWLLARRRARVA